MELLELFLTIKIHPKLSLFPAVNMEVTNALLWYSSYCSMYIIMDEHKIAWVTNLSYYSKITNGIWVLRYEEGQSVFDASFLLYLKNRFIPDV